MSFGAPSTVPNPGTLRKSLLAEWMQEVIFQGRKRTPRNFFKAGLDVLLVRCVLRERKTVHLVSLHV